LPSFSFVLTILNDINYSTSYNYIRQYIFLFFFMFFKISLYLLYNRHYFIPINTYNSNASNPISWECRATRINKPYSIYILYLRYMSMSK